MASNRVVASTIVRPETEARLGKRSFQESDSASTEPQNHRRISSNTNGNSSISSRLGPLPHNDDNHGPQVRTTSSLVVAGPKSTTTAPSSDSQSSNTNPDTTNAPASSLTSTNTDTTTAAESPQAKRPRLALNPAEDTRRNRRIMGLVIGTLTDFKNQQSRPSTSSRGGATHTTGGTNGIMSSSSLAGGVASREALQERVREKLRREQELNQELRRKEIEERNEQRLRQQSQRGGPGGRRRDVKWENGYVLTETRPRLRYMPKVMNDTVRKKLEIQQQGRGGARPKNTASSSELSADFNIKTSPAVAPSSSSSTIATTGAGVEAAASSAMDLDLDGVDADLVVDIIATKETQGSLDHKDQSPVLSETPSSIAVEASPSTERSVIETPATGSEDAVMAEEISSSASAKDATTESASVDVTDSEKPALINISLK